MKKINNKITFSQENLELIRNPWMITVVDTNLDDWTFCFIKYNKLELIEITLMLVKGTLNHVYVTYRHVCKSTCLEWVHSNKPLIMCDKNLR